MSFRSTLFLAALALAALGGYSWTRYRAMHPGPRVEAVLISGEPDKHKVTPAMLSAAEARERRAAPSFHQAGADGVTYDLEAMLRDGPLVLVFIKDGCPCSVSAEAYFHAIHAAYRGKIRFL